MVLNNGREMEIHVYRRIFFLPELVLSLNYVNLITVHFLRNPMIE